MVILPNIDNMIQISSRMFLFLSLNCLIVDIGNWVCSFGSLKSLIISQPKCPVNVVFIRWWYFQEMLIRIHIRVLWWFLWFSTWFSWFLIFDRLWVLCLVLLSTLWHLLIIKIFWFLLSPYTKSKSNLFLNKGSKNHRCNLNFSFKSFNYCLCFCGKIWFFPK